MRALVSAVVLLGLLGTGGAAFAAIGTGDQVPAATLLLPYFEVDLNQPNGVTTLFSINNASASAAVAHVTLWTDEAIPSLAFDVYLTGYDVQTINIRDIFNGVLPVTADAGADTAPPVGHVSPKGQFSQDINFPGATGPCGNPSTLYNAPDPTLATKIAHIRAAHQGLFSSVYGGCLGAAYGDGLARGYITVDSVTACNLSFPSDPGYFTALADNRNILWGDYFFVNSGQDFAQGDPLVHVEACELGAPFYRGVGSAGGHCPFVAGNYTFYGRYAAVAGQDQREPLATTFASRYANGAAFSGGTSITVWRDTKTRPVGANGTHACGGAPSWYPLNQTDVVSFDEQEHPTDQCFLTDNVAPVTGGSRSCFPLATQRIHTAGGNAFAQDLALPSPFGWLYLNLNFTLAAGDPYPGIAQAWVTTIMDASGRFSVGYSATQLDNALTAVPNGNLLIP